MIKDTKRYRSFMIVFEDDRYYICKASSFDKNGNNRYAWKDIESIDDAKKIIDKYWEDKEVSESMVKYVESKDDEDLEVLNEFEDEDIPYPEKPNLLNLTDYYMDKYDMDYDNAIECARGDLAGAGKFTYHELEATNPSSIGQFKKSPINRARKSKRTDEDRIVTKDDEINKPTNVKDDGSTNDTININVPVDNSNSDNTSNTGDKQEQQKDEVILTEDEMSVDDKKKWLESASNEELLKQYVSFINQNRFGSTAEDINLTKEEILKRMSK